MTATTVRPETAVKRPAIRVEYRPHPARAFLQRQAPRNIMRHCIRDAWRTGVLVASDLIVYAVLHRAVSGVRVGVLGEWLAEWTQLLFPSGFLGGWRFALALILSMLIVGAYGQGDKRRDKGRVLAGVALAGLLALYGSFWQNPSIRVCVQYLCTIAAFGTAMALSRTAIDWTVTWVRGRVGGDRTILVVREGADWREVAGLVQRSREFLFVGTLRLASQSDNGKRGELLKLGDVIQEHHADTVLLWGDLSEAEFEFAVDIAMASGCCLISQRSTAPAAGINPRALWIGGKPLVRLTNPSVRAWQLAAKRLLDITVAMIGLAVLSPVLAAIAVAVKVGSPGPVFSAQTRLSVSARTFKCYRFRSTRGGRGQALRSDVRATWIGRLLLRTGMDEWPQLVNVFRGDMSLVGPRPIMPQELAHYGWDAQLILSRKPGLTGPWAVGPRSEIGHREEVRAELAYLRNWNLLTDLWILARAIPAMLCRRGPFGESVSGNPELAAPMDVP